MTDSFDIAIIGGGYTGAVVALHLLRTAPAKTRVAIVETRIELGSGIAYSTRADEHRINVPAERMGAGAAPADRFDVWLKTHHPELIGDGTPENTYVARRWFGIFVRDRLTQALNESPVSLVHIRARALSIQSGAGGNEIDLSDGRSLHSRHIVIAVSHGMPALPKGASASLCGTHGFLENPWDISRLDEIPADGAVFIIGTGLTMADVIASLAARGHRGRITAISRRGLLSRKAGPADVPSNLDLAEWPPASLAVYAKRIRREVARLEADGLSWRGLFTALRRQSAHLWANLSYVEKQRFLRHLKAFYDVHRYRMTPETHDLVEAARARGQIEIIAANLVRVEPIAQGFDVIFRRRHAAIDERCRVAAVVNCTGPKQQLRADPTNFLGALIAQGLAIPDPLRLGLSVDNDFRVAGRGRNFYALGPLTRERFGDTYGAPEIQRDAERLAGLLSAALIRERTSMTLTA